MKDREPYMNNDYLKFAIVIVAAMFLAFFAGGMYETTKVGHYEEGYICEAVDSPLTEEMP